MKLLKLVFLFTLFTSFSISDHLYHASIATVDLDTKERLAKISIQVFTDDLYQLLEERFNIEPAKLNEMTPEQNENLKTYTENKFQLVINRKPIAIHFLGLEEEQNYTTLYLEGTIPKKPQRIELSNAILTEIFSDQLNTIHITLGSVTKSVHLNSSKQKDILFFNSSKE